MARSQLAALPGRVLKYVDLPAQAPRSAPIGRKSRRGSLVAPSASNPHTQHRRRRPRSHLLLVKRPSAPGWGRLQGPDELSGRRAGCKPLRLLPAANTPYKAIEGPGLPSEASIMNEHINGKLKRVTTPSPPGSASGECMPWHLPTYWPATRIDGSGSPRTSGTPSPAFHGEDCWMSCDPGSGTMILVRLIEKLMDNGRKRRIPQGQPLCPWLLAIYLDHVLDKPWRRLASGYSAPEVGG